MGIFSKGLLYKKIFNEDGTLSENVPFFVKTLAKLVFTTDGQSVEDKLDALDKKKSYEVYQTKDEYLTALENGEISEDTLAVILEDE